MMSGYCKICTVFSAQETSVLMQGYNSTVFHAFKGFDSRPLSDSCIGVGRFRILVGPRFRILGGGGGGGQGGGKFPAGT